MQGATTESAAINRFTKFWFDTAHNRLYLNDTINMSIDGTTITGRIPYYTRLGKLTPSFEFEGGHVTIGDSVQTSGMNAQDFRQPVYYTVVGEDHVATNFSVSLINFTGLPVVKVYTANGAAITSTETYLTGTVAIDGAGNYDDISTSSMRIKGHGHSSWGYPKHSFKIKFDSKTAVLGHPKSKNWVLVANYIDKTMIRNSTAYYMGQLSNQDWSPHSTFAELYINDVYLGPYQICEQIESGTNRVNVGDDGYVMEVNDIDRMDPDDIYFQTSRITLQVKDPDLATGDDKYNYVKDYVTLAEDVLFGDSFLDAEQGYAKYIDLDSFVDWYLINEITKNNDATFISSCYMNLVPGGKLKMGPVWDFDIAMGNINYNNNADPTGFWVKKAAWISRMFQDPVFVEKVKSRFSYFKSQEEMIFSYINAQAASLKWSIIENNNKYQTLYNYAFPNSAIWGSYDNEIIAMKNWLDTRFTWMESALSAL